MERQEDRKARQSKLGGWRDGLAALAALAEEQAQCQHPQGGL